MDVDNIDNTSSELSYEVSQEREIHLRTVAENYEDILPLQDKLTNNNQLKYSPGQVPDSTLIQGLTVQNEKSIFINILLLYDSNTSADPEI